MKNPAAATFAEEDAATLAQPITDITPVTRIKEFHDGENVEWGRSTVRDDWLMCVYTKSDDFLENVQILLQRAPTM